MKVLCVDANGSKGFLKEGKIYDATDYLGVICSCYIGVTLVVINDIPVPSRCSTCFKLNEFPVFKASRFIPISDTDEKELLEQRNNIQQVTN